MITVLSKYDAQKWAEKNLYEADSYLFPLNVAIKHGLLIKINEDNYAVSESEFDNGCTWKIDKVWRLSDEEMQAHDLYYRYRYKAHVTNCPSQYNGCRAICAGIKLACN